MAPSRRAAGAKKLAVTVYHELFRTRAIEIAGSMAFSFLFSLMPLLIFTSALIGFLPVPHLFDQLHQMLQTFVPAANMATAESIAASSVTERHGGLLSFGLLTSLYSVTTAFASTIEALDVAYDVSRERPWWSERLRALVLAFSSGGLCLVSLLLLMLGPHFGHFLLELVPVPAAFAKAWPLLRIVITLIALILGVQLLYYLAPNRKQRFSSNFPGAVIAVIGWIIGSLGLEYYFAHISNYSRTYGSLGLVMSLMLWFYLIALAILIGAEWNAERAKQIQAAQTSETTFLLEHGGRKKSA